MSVVHLGVQSPGCGLRLPATSDRLGQLREQLVAFGDLPYSSGTRGFEVRGGDEAFTATQALPVIAERLSLPEEVCDFDPTPFLSPTFRQIFEDPDLFLKSSEEMPEPIKIRGTASRSELLKVLSRWDRLGRLYICSSRDVSVEDWCELFAVAKDCDRDRQILHRKRRNRRERLIVGASKDLPHGVLLCQLPLGQDFISACSVDDVQDFYHAYSATEARAKSSLVGPLFRQAEVAHLKAFQQAKSAGRISPQDRVACCFRGLGMGDHAAVDIAQESHVNLVRAFGGMVEGEVLRYRCPVPRPPTGFYEGIMIDDHLGVQLLRRRRTLSETLAQPAMDQEAFAASTRAYNSSILRAHPKKAKRRSLHVQVWGVELEGIKGLVGPTRGRLLALGKLSADLAPEGPVDQQVIEGATGLWGFYAQFRRPIFSFFYHVYHEKGPEARNQPFRLSPGARNEFAVLACLSPLCLTDLRALPDEYLHCVDASPTGAGVCRTFVGSSVAKEVWRRGGQAGV